MTTRNNFVQHTLYEVIRPEHKKVQSEFLNKSSKSLVLYIMEGTFGSDDDNALLQRVADSMKVGGKQSKDRITSYNVCYTKLLRKQGELPQETSWNL